MKIKKSYIDVSDTMALPPNGENKFIPHEYELLNIVLNDMAIFGNKNEIIKFNTDAQKGCENFYKVRRDNNISIMNRYLIWLKPFIGHLKEEHVKTLIKNWRINTDFLKGIKLIDTTINTLILK